MLQRASGVTSIELALVLGATLVVVAVGHSAYRTYAVRAQISAGVMAVTWVRHSVERSFKKNGWPPATGDDLELPANEYPSLVHAIRIQNGRIELTFDLLADTAISGRSLFLTPFETAEQRVVWICGNRPPGVGLNPLGFAGGTNLAVQAPTSIDARFLPAVCR
jgi:hypothetical protein